MCNLPIQIKLPQDFLKEEMRDGFVVTSSMKKLWAVEIDILFQIMDICSRHNIKWYADGGTLLGAARHKGFIPWDDDIDIDMFREDYNKFIYYAKRELKPPYFIQTNETDPESMYGHAKIRNSMTTGMQLSELGANYKFNQGIFVDIFPMDDIDDDIHDAKNRAELAFHFFAEARYRMYDVKKIYFYPLRKNIIKWIYYNLKLYKSKLQYFTEGDSFYKKQYSQFEETMMSLKGHSKNHTFIYPTGWKKSQYWDKHLFEGDLIMLPFEWFEIPVMPRYKELLTVIFGNWSKFVKGTSIHGSLFFDAERSYTEYLK